MKSILESYSILLGSSIGQALKVMDKNNRKLLIIVDEQQKYSGLLSIGDIQRAILKGVDLNKCLREIMREDYIIAKSGDSRDEVRNRMFAIRAEFMPIIDDYGQIVDIISWEDLFENNRDIPVDQFNIPVVIMAGGLGTRLRPLTNVLPKPLIPVGDKTMLEEIFNRFTKHGCDNFYISVNYKADLISFYLDSLKLPYRTKCFVEDNPLGTAGSLHLLNGEIESTFFVSNCDILIEDDYAKILRYHKENGNEITIISAYRHMSIPYGTLEVGENGKLIALKEKPDLSFSINTGMYILEPHLLKEIPKNKFYHITHLIGEVLTRNGKVGVFPVSEKSWKDIGTWDEYIRNFS